MTPAPSSSLSRFDSKVGEIRGRPRRRSLNRVEPLSSSRSTSGVHFEHTISAAITRSKTLSVYLIADIKVTDGAWIPGYASSVHHIVHRHGGKYLARSGHVKTLEGKPLDTTLIALIEFPSEEAVQAFAADPAYA